MVRDSVAARFHVGGCLVQVFQNEAGYFVTRLALVGFYGCCIVGVVQFGGDDWEVAELLQVIEIDVSTEEIHLADILLYFDRIGQCAVFQILCCVIQEAVTVAQVAVFIVTVFFRNDNTLRKEVIIRIVGCLIVAVVIFGKRIDIFEVG